MIKEADIIVEGYLENINGKAYIKVIKLYKGNIKLNEIIELKSYHKILGIDMEEFLMSNDKKKCIVLGTKQGGNIIRLNWHIYSIWSYGIKNIENSLEKVKLYIEEVMIYLQERNQKKLISRLITNVDIMEKRPIVLDIINDILDEKYNNEKIKEEILFIVMSELILKNYYDKETFERVLRLLPIAPPSLALQYLNNALNIKDKNVSKLARKHIISILQIRRIIQRKDIKSISNLKNVVRKSIENLKIFDAKRALNIFDSEIPEIKEKAKLVLRTILR